MSVSALFILLKPWFSYIFFWKESWNIECSFIFCILLFQNHSFSAQQKKHNLHLSWMLLLFSRSVVSDSLWPQELQHARLPYPSLSSRVCSNSCSLSQLMPFNCLILCRSFSYCSQSFPAPVFSNELTFCIRCQRIGASASVLSEDSMNIREYSGLISFRLD